MKIIDKINKNADEKFKKMSKILNLNKKYQIKFNKNKDEIDIFYKNKKLLSGKYNFYGIIKPDGHFYWANILPGISKDFSKKVLKVKKFNNLFENYDNKDSLFFNHILTNDSTLLNNNEIEKLNKLILFLTKDFYFFTPISPNGNLQLIFLSEITEKYI